MKTMEPTRERGMPARPVRRPRWAIPAVAAAAVLAASTGVVLAVQVSQHHTAPDQAAGQAAPIGAASPSAGPAGTTGTAGTAGTSAGHPTGSTTPPNPGGRTVRVGALTLSLPGNWHEANPQTGSGRTTVCLAADAPQPAGCELWVTAMTDGQVGPVSVDSYAGLLPKEAPTCVAGNQHGTVDTTTAYEVRTLGDRKADYRAYTKACDRVYHYEQWTVPTWPAVQLTTTDDQPAVTADVRGIVASARFSTPDSGHRVMDNGLLVRHSTGPAGELRITLDRTIRVFGGPDNGHDVDTSSATYDYRVSPRVRIVDDGLELCGINSIAAGKTCPLSAVLSRIDKHQARGIVQLSFDQAGVVVGIDGEYRP